MKDIKSEGKYLFFFNNCYRYKKESNRKKVRYSGVKERQVSLFSISEQEKWKATLPSVEMGIKIGGLTWKINKSDW